MTSLRRSLHPFRPALILLLQEALLFLLLFVMLGGWFAQIRGAGELARTFDLLQFLSLMSESRVAPVMSQAVLLTFVLSLLLRQFLLGGVFGAWRHGYHGFGLFLAECARHFWRFLALFLIFALPAFLLNLFLGELLGRIVYSVDHTQWAFFLGLGQLALQYLFFSFLFYFLALSRWHVVDAGKLRIRLRGRAKKLLAFLLYSLLSGLALAVFALLALLLLLRRPGWALPTAILLFHLGLLLRILFQFAAWRSAEP